MAETWATSSTESNWEGVILPKKERVKNTNADGKRRRKKIGKIREKAFIYKYQGRPNAGPLYGGNKC